MSTSTVLATRDQLFSTNEQLALAGFLAGYSRLTRDAYTLDLRQYVAWCTEHRVAVFGARRADIECFARHLEALGRAATLQWRKPRSTGRARGARGRVPDLARPLSLPQTASLIPRPRRAVNQCPAAASTQSDAG